MAKSGGSMLAVAHDQLMRIFFSCSSIAAVAAAPIAAVALFSAGIVSAGIASADPLNCVNGQFWDPITNTCQTPRPAAACAPGDYWNPLSNVCRPVGQL